MEDNAHYEIKKGIKHDEGKLQFSLVPLDALEEVMKIYDYGAKRYGTENWKHVENWKDRYSNALIRHFLEYRKGNNFDIETQYYHLAHLAWNALSLLQLEIEEKYDAITQKTY